MLSPERVRRAISHQSVDRVPCGEIVVDDDLVSDFLDCAAVRFDERRAFVERLGLDLVCLSPALPALRGTMLPAAEDITWPDLSRWAKDSDDFVFVTLDGAFGWGFRTLGYEECLLALASEAPEVTEELPSAVEQLNLALATRAADWGAMAVLIADDIAYQQGLMVPSALLRRHFFPSLARQAEGIKALGLPVFFHSDGNLTPVLDDLAALGFDGLHGLEAAAGMDIAAVKQRYGDRLCLWGNLDPAELLLPRGEAQLARSVRRITDLGRDGGLIFGTSSGLIKGMRGDSLRTVYEIARQQ